MSKETEQEPVAMWDGKYQIEFGNLSAYKHGEHSWIPLYTSLPAQQEPVAIVDANDEGYWAEILPDRSVKVGQLLYTSPPAQRKPLTDEEIDAEATQHEQAHGFIQGVQWATAKLKAKNSP